MHKTTVTTCNIETRKTLIRVHYMHSIPFHTSHGCFKFSYAGCWVSKKSNVCMLTSSFIISNTSQHQRSLSSQSSHPHLRLDSHTADQERKAHNELQPRRRLPYTLSPSTCLSSQRRYQVTCRTSCLFSAYHLLSRMPLISVSLLVAED
jgi:hypothetical protein